MSPTTASEPDDTGSDPDIDMSPEAMKRRAEQGPLQILKMPPDDNPGLPPEVWLVPPEGFKLPE